MKRNILLGILAGVTLLLIVAAVFLWIGVANGGRSDAAPQQNNAAVQTAPGTEPAEETLSEPAGQQTQATTEPAGPAAPDFTVYTADGTEVHLSDFRGKPVVLNFWATWCGPCKAEMPAFNKLNQELGDQVQFVMVNLTDGVQDTVAGASAFIADAGYTFPVYYDTDGVASYLYGISAIPATFIIDENGCVVNNHVGTMDESTLRNYVNQILQ